MLHPIPSRYAITGTHRAGSPHVGSLVLGANRDRNWGLKLDARLLLLLVILLL